MTMRFLNMVAAVAVLGLAAGAVQAQIVNLPSFDLSNPNVATSPTVLSFGPGTYSVKTIGTAQGGLYNGWAYTNSGTNGNYGETYGISYNGSTTAVNTGPVYSTAAAALAAYQNIVTTFTLAAATNVAFQITDSFYFDNAGGVSLQISPVNVPEPPTLVLFAIAVAGALFFWRRRAAAV